MQEDESSDTFFQEHSFGRDEPDHFMVTIEAKEQEILKLRRNLDEVKEMLKDYKRKEVQLCDLIQQLADKLKGKKTDTSGLIRESVRGKQEITLPFLANSTKNWAASLRSTSPHARSEDDLNIYGLLDKICGVG